jgi:hypothetical protein
VRKSQAGEDRNQAAPEAVETLRTCDSVKNCVDQLATEMKGQCRQSPENQTWKGLNRDEEQRKNKWSMVIWGNSTAEEPFA